VIEGRINCLYGVRIGITVDYIPIAILGGSGRDAADLGPVAINFVAEQVSISNRILGDGDKARCGNLDVQVGRRGWGSGVGRRIDGQAACL
jgi:hypothetical protein